MIIVINEDLNISPGFNKNKRISIIIKFNKLEYLILS